METQMMPYDVCRGYLADVGHELGPELQAKALGFLRSRNLKGLCSMSELEGWHCLSARQAQILLQIEAFFKKNADLSDEKKCFEAARKSFMDAERRCRITNRRLDYYYDKRHRLDADLALWWKRAEIHIRRVLGPFGRFFEEIPQRIRVTDGATSTRSRQESIPYLKIRGRLMCSEAGSPYLRALATFYGYDGLRIKTTCLNRVEVVPKSWKTHRTIACEPDGSLPFQLAFDDYAKERLRRIGVDLSDQLRNQALAKQGSIDGSLATIDLSAASDTVSLNVVHALFPEGWRQYLTSFRSSHYKGKFGLGKYAKFSSMGNGSTFAIETLIFAGACYAVGSKTYSVYGDDIIIETDKVPALLRFLRFLGFRVNTDKSFWDGPYRESCGAYWYLGQSVTPFFMRGEYSGKPDYCHLVNGLSSIGTPEGSLWAWCKSLTRRLQLPIGPFQDDSTRYVNVDVPTSHRLRLIKTPKVGEYSWIPRVKGFVHKNITGEVRDSRTLFLWYLNRYRLNKNPQQLKELITSRIPTSKRKYVRKWVRWIPPASATPDHLYWWAEFLLRES
jgi:hypothetical protein